jgi:metal-responsive CopG/Arc/MetJ family transcriptional regulator
MRISVDLPDDDVALLDRYAASSRSAAIHEAINLLRQERLTKEYEGASEKWNGSADARLWNNVLE